MTNIRVRCQSCGAAALLRPAQILLLAYPGEASGNYLFLCPSCGCVTAKSAGGEELHVLLRAGVADAGEESRPNQPRPGRTVDSPPLTPDDLLDFHLLLGDPQFQATFARYPDSTVASPHLFQKVAVPGICVDR
jgi:hypothetical protein